MVIDRMNRANIVGDFLAWRDFLHTGPVPKEFTLQQLSKIRSYFIHEEGFGDFVDIYLNFQKRNAILDDYRSYDKIILWFEHDLYDQLQLLQILAWFAEQTLIESPKITLICTKNCLAKCSEQQLLTLSLYEEIVTEKHLTLAQRAWSAFREPTPLAWFHLLQEETRTLPFLKDTVLRLLEEYPNRYNGLSRSAHEALVTIAQGKKRPYEIFTAYQAREERKFMGDVLFFKVLEEFKEYKLIFSQEHGRKLTITPLGQEVLQGKKNWLKLKPINYWIGGVSLTPNNLWCWDSKKKNIAKYYYSEVLSFLLPVQSYPIG